jgi:2-oxoglutarate dehydrogenase E2 component (dihydrolipoamide succinyltransferase)
MPTVTMPQLGEGVEEGTIGRWLKKEGDHVAVGEPIVEIVTDKVNAEVPSPFEGTIAKLLVAEGQTVQNDAGLAEVVAAGEAASADAASTADAAPTADPVPTAAAAPAVSADASQEAPAPVSAATATAEPEAPDSPDSPAAPPAPAAPTNGEGADASATRPLAAVEVVPDGSAFTGRATPAVRRLAREHAIDLAAITGTGMGGRVTREDVEKAVAQGGARTAPTPTQPTAGPPPTSPAKAPAEAAPSPVAEGDSLKKLSPMRRAIAAQMTKSLEVPAAYIMIEVDMSPVVRRRERMKREYQAREGISLSYVAFVTKACVEALRKHPDFNAHWTEEGHWRRKAINVGIAVAVADGLLVPVIHDADTLSLHGLNVAINDLAARARNKKIRPEDLQGGTFTVDNTGWTGSILTLPIINVPEVAIITMEKVVKRPVVIESPDGDVIAIRSIMNMCIAIDHRATDGAQAGEFLATVKGWLESVDDDTAIW